MIIKIEFIKIDFSSSKEIDTVEAYRWTVPVNRYFPCHPTGLGEIKVFSRWDWTKRNLFSINVADSTLHRHSRTTKL